MGRATSSCVTWEPPASGWSDRSHGCTDAFAEDDLHDGHPHVAGEDARSSAGDAQPSVPPGNPPDHNLIRRSQISSGCGFAMCDSGCCAGAAFTSHSLAIRT